jgi:hypothetical protein
MSLSRGNPRPITKKSILDRQKIEANFSNPDPPKD